MLILSVARLHLMSPYTKLNLEGPVDAHPSYSDTVFSLSDFHKTVKFTEFHKPDPDTLKFTLSGTNSAPLANALRRIILAEVETVCIDKVFLYQNTSVIADEILSHRIGMIPVKVKNHNQVGAAAMETGSIEWDQDRAIKMRLHVKCTEGRKTVYARDIQILTGGDVELIYPDIIIAKLAPGQEIEAELYALRGSSKIHAKFSPVSTAWYRMKPRVTLLGGKKIKGIQAKEIEQVCPMGVFDIEDAGNLVVADSNKCTACRLCIEKFPDLVEIGKDMDQFQFTVESVGTLSPEEIVHQAIIILREKCLKAKDVLTKKTSH
jgi:DNA-directed RNA polymerases I and III subunit RPAC1